METKTVTRSKTFEIPDVKDFNSKINSFIKEIAQEDIIAANYSVVVNNGVLTHCANFIFRKEIVVKPAEDTVVTTTTETTVNPANII